MPFVNTAMSPASYLRCVQSSPIEQNGRHSHGECERKQNKKKRGNLFKYHLHWNTESLADTSRWLEWWLYVRSICLLASINQFNLPSVLSHAPMPKFDPCANENGRGAPATDFGFFFFQFFSLWVCVYVSESKCLIAKRRSPGTLIHWSFWSAFSLPLHNTNIHGRTIHWIDIQWLRCSICSPVERTQYGLTNSNSV